jgi:hypothetical protein
MTTGADVETGVVLGDVAVCASGVVEAATSPLLSSMTTGNVTTAVVVGGAVVTGTAVAAGSSLSVPQETTANTLSPRTMIRRVMTPLYLSISLVGHPVPVQKPSRK